LDKQTEKMFMIHTQLEEYHKHLLEAEQIIQEVLLKSKKPYVAFSGGKDSTVLLHLVLQQAPDITVFHFIWPENIMPKVIEREVMVNLRKIGAKNIICRTERENTRGSGFFASISELSKQGYDVSFIGLRKEESCRRKMRIKNNSFYTSIREIYPIQDWTWKDVWGYIIQHHLPYPSVYDEYASVIGWDKARFVSFFDPEFERLGSLNVDGVFMWRYKNHI